MIRINLHDYRYELRKIEIQKRVVKCSAVIIAAIFLIIGSWLVGQTRLDLIRSETRKVESQVAGLKSHVEKIKAMEVKQKRMATIIAGIEGLREKQMPASTIVSDLNTVVPEGLWLTSIIQKDAEGLQAKRIPVIMYGDPAKKKKKKKKKKVAPPKEFVEVSGYALTEKGVVEYMRRLQELPYYETTFLYKSAQEVIGDQEIYNFIIYCYMPEKKKSA
ncbi:MAG: PilN domain-containing protein [Nitrospinae bacterium]|nr:PilN domain-containing protein [Nitrospinota bacterium]MBL7019540.1 PilN domain-containing protein [Nitrospinaceae bacterium]